MLVEALPWLERFHGRTVVVKYGGNAMTDEALRAAFAEDIVFLRYAGLRPVVVHGGGPQISSMLDRLGVPTEFRGGHRVTTAETMDVVRMVLTGQVQREIVGLINDARPVRRRAVRRGRPPVHRRAARRGRRRRVARTSASSATSSHVEPGLVTGLLDDGRIPVVSSVARGVDGTVYNVNADTAAAALAVALGAEKLIVLTDVEGLYADWPASNGRRQRSSPPTSSRSCCPTLASGMVPKMEACLRAVRGGVPKAHVIDGRVPHALLLEVFTAEGIGTHGGPP